jgi:hypothetical protein
MGPSTAASALSAYRPGLTAVDAAAANGSSRFHPLSCFLIKISCNPEIFRT